MNVHNGNSVWLAEFAENVTSQFGEDGIIAKILEVMGIESGWCVEFGAWDGKHLSNTYNLISNHGFSAVMIEGDRLKFAELKRTYAQSANVIPLHAFVGSDLHNSLDAILLSTPVPRDFEVLSIDIDGNDFHVWKAVNSYHAKVVVVEYNPTIPNEVEFVQPNDWGVNQGSSLLSLCKLGREKGYELVFATNANGIFVQQKYFPLFQIADNSLAVMRPNPPEVTHIFQGYDGTIHVCGCEHLVWHNVPIRQKKFQQIPLFFRKYPERFTPIQRKLFSLYQKLLGINR